MGLDLINGTVRNNLEAGVIEPAMSKVKILQVINYSYVHKFVFKNLYLILRGVNTTVICITVCNGSSYNDSSN
ncbi:hypothetical protein HanHA89_Chr16g0680261 [Helianthus annuus]|nr:hypothetical protein HanHA89_Chr16g0680261 [Helianthus annuus]